MLCFVACPNSLSTEVGGIEVGKPESAAKKNSGGKRDLPGNTFAASETSKSPANTVESFFALRKRSDYGIHIPRLTDLADQVARTLRCSPRSILYRYFVQQDHVNLFLAETGLGVYKELAPMRKGSGQSG